MLSDDYRRKLSQESQPATPQPAFAPVGQVVPGHPPLAPGQIEKFFGWKVTSVLANTNQLQDAEEDPFFVQFAQQVCDHLAIAQLQGMNSVTVNDHQFAVTVLELPLKEGDNTPLPPEQAAMFARPIAHQLIDGMTAGTIRLVEGEPPSAPVDPQKYGLAGWGMPGE